jgi:tRNA (mo5U34)-methyltransferase
MAIADEATSRTWYHTIDLPGGGHTEGWYDCRRAPRHVEWPAAVQGGRCLDVGTFDGFWAFELERRGASEVIALDVDEPEQLDWFYDEHERGPELVRSWGSDRGPGFVEAARLTGSRAQRVGCSIYDLTESTAGRFDVVFCGALLLHLADPIRALERMRAVCDGELVLVEHLDGYLELTAPRTPAAHFSADWDQWWRANSAGLAAMVDRAGFEIEATGKRFLVPYGPAAPDFGWRATALHALAAGRPTKRGLLFRSLRARPRERRPRR